VIKYGIPHDHGVITIYNVMNAFLAFQEAPPCKRGGSLTVSKLNLYYWKISPLSFLLRRGVIPPFGNGRSGGIS
jgi:hypothetical protein